MENLNSILMFDVHVFSFIQNIDWCKVLHVSFSDRVYVLNYNTSLYIISIQGKL